MPCHASSIDTPPILLGGSAPSVTRQVAGSRVVKGLRAKMKGCL